MVTGESTSKQDISSYTHHGKMKNEMSRWTSVYTEKKLEKKVVKRE